MANLENPDAAGTIALLAYRRVAEALHVGVNVLEMEGHALKESQQVTLWTAALQCVDGLRDEIQKDIEVDNLLHGLAKELKKR